MTEGWIALGAVALIALAVVFSYNRFVSQTNLMRDAWANVDTELQRRYDLVPNLVETTRGYAAHERQLFEEVTRARAVAMASTGAVGQQSADERQLVGALGRLLAVAEAYPQLRADELFLQLQRELVDTEDRIQVARRLFNGNVRDYNRRVESVPSNIIAGVFGFRRADYFEVEPVARAAPDVGGLDRT